MPKPETLQQIVKDFTDGNLHGAKNSFKDAVLQAVGEKIEGRKKDIAATLFDPEPSQEAPADDAGNASKAT